MDIIRQRELPMSQSLTVSVAVGNFVQEIGTIRLANSNTQSGGINFELLFLLIPAFALFVLIAIACGTLIAVIGCAIIRMKGTRYIIVQYCTY